MEICSLVKLDFVRLLVLPALMKRRLLTKVSSVAYWFLVQISAFVGIWKLPGIPMLTALTEKWKNLSLGRIVELPWNILSTWNDTLYNRIVLKQIKTKSHVSKKECYHHIVNVSTWLCCFSVCGEKNKFATQLKGK